MTGYINKKRITELKNQAEALEERFVLNEINAEQYAKFSKKFETEIAIIEEENYQQGYLSSNLKKSVEKSLEIAENKSQIWLSADFYDKQKLQYLLFPEGMYYDKEKGVVLTRKTNRLFLEIAVQERVSEENKKGNLFLKIDLLETELGLHISNLSSNTSKLIAAPLS